MKECNFFFLTENWFSSVGKGHSWLCLASLPVAWIMTASRYFSGVIWKESACGRGLMHNQTCNPGWCSQEALGFPQPRPSLRSPSSHFPKRRHQTGHHSGVSHRERTQSKQWHKKTPFSRRAGLWGGNLLVLVWQMITMLSPSRSPRSLRRSELWCPAFVSEARYRSGVVIHVNPYLSEQAGEMPSPSVLYLLVSFLCPSK